MGKRGIRIDKAGGRLKDGGVWVKSGWTAREQLQDEGEEGKEGKEGEGGMENG